jgi:hypothetical protein
MAVKQPVRIFQPVGLSFQPLIFSQLVVFYLTTNQPTVLSAAYFQPKRTRCLLLNGASLEEVEINYCMF